MQKPHHIKWRESDYEDIERLVKNFNAKVAYHSRKHPELREALPEKIKTENIINKVYSRQDLNRELNSLSRFLERGAEKTKVNDKGVKITNWEYKEVSMKVAQINRQRTIKLKEAQKDAHKKGVVKSTKEHELQPKKLNFEKKTGTEWELFVKSVEKQIMSNYTLNKAQLYKENYLKAIVRNLGFYGRDLYNVVSQIDPMILYENYYEDALVQIQFTSEDIDSDIINDESLERWLELMEDKYGVEIDMFKYDEMESSPFDIAYNEDGEN